jgi:hypothetical protein
MRMNLGLCIEIFGPYDGFKQFIAWNFIDPIKFKLYDYLPNKEWCPYAGWFCTNKNCKHKHYSKAPNEKDYPFTKDLKCQYCGDKDADSRIWNPNHPDNPPFYWLVCDDCVRVIDLQDQISMHAGLMNMAPTEEIRDKAESNFINGTNMLKKMLKNQNRDATSISIQIGESGKPIFTELIKKKKEPKISPNK